MASVSAGSGTRAVGSCQISDSTAHEIGGVVNDQCGSCACACTVVQPNKRLRVVEISLLPPQQAVSPFLSSTSYKYRGDM